MSKVYGSGKKSNIKFPRQVNVNIRSKKIGFVDTPFITVCLTQKDSFPGFNFIGGGTGLPIQMKEDHFIRVEESFRVE